MTTDTSNPLAADDATDYPAADAPSATVAKLPKRKGRRAVPKGIEPNNMLGQRWVRYAEATAILNDIDFSEVIVCDPEPGEPKHSGGVVFEGELELRMRKLIDHFGFSRLPFTVLELGALQHYCQLVLSTTSVVRNIPPSEGPIYAESAIRVTSQYYPAYAEGLRAYLDGAPETLRAFHGAPDIYETLGREYLRQCGEEVAEPEAGAGTNADEAEASPGSTARRPQLRLVQG